MHELSVTESILEIALTHAKSSGATRVTDINLVIGQLSSIVDDSVQFYWNYVSEDSICSGAVLHFKRVKARFECIDCGQVYQLENELSLCPACKSSHTRIVSGEEFFVDSIEIEKEVEKTNDRD